MISRWITGVLCGAALLGTTFGNALPAAADQAPHDNGPGVARMSVVQGPVVVQRGDSNTQTDAVVNAPLLPGDYISTGNDARAELQFDGETAVRLGGNVQARVTDNDPSNRAIQLADGTIEVGIVRGTQPFQVDTPSVSVRAADAGDYRITIDRDGSTWVTVRRGQAEVITPHRTYDLSSGRTLVARGAASDPAIDYAPAVGFDSFDDFNANRDRAMVAALDASPNLSPTIAGYDNLDQYGTWQDVSGYGQVWVPQESADWAPYRDGSWAWEGGYGWTWVGAEPWGWAPYHYGRWFWANGYGWAWYPPPYAYYTPWYPALVGFYGWGGGFGLSLGFGFAGIGWCPLAPFEPFYSWYPGWAWRGGAWGWRSGGWRGWGTRVVNITNIHNVYRNFAHGGGSGTLRGNFEHGNFSHNVAVTSRNAGRIGSIRGAVPVTPTRANLGFGRTPATRVAFSHAFDSSRFASNRAVEARGTFAREQRSVASAIDRSARTAQASRATESARSGSAASSRDFAASRDQSERTGAARSASWSRFNSERGEIRPSYGDRNAYGSSASRGSDDRSYSRSGSYDRSYSHNPYGSYSRGGSYDRSYSRNPYGSYSRGGSYDRSYSRGSYPSYSHGSYPSYSHGSYPSYSRGSYPSYSRGSYPSYSHGSYPSYSHGSYPSRGSSGSAPHSSGGGGHGGGRPPH